MLITTKVIENIATLPSKFSRTLYEIPDKVDPEIGEATTVKRPSLRKAILGKTHRLPKNRYLAMLFVQNELLACEGRGTDVHGIHRRLRSEFPKKKDKNFLSKYSEYRRKYNAQKLYLNQTAPSLYAWTRNELGYIVHSRYTSRMITFETCKGELKGEKFADPRFFSEEEIEKILSEQLLGNLTDWKVPSRTEIMKMENRIGRSLFLSLPFANGYDFILK